MPSRELPDLSPQQAVVLLAYACEPWRLAFGDEIPPEGDTSPQATEKRLELFGEIKALCLRHRFSGTVTAAQRRAALGHLKLVSLVDAFAQAAASPDSDEEGGAA